MLHALLLFALLPRQRRYKGRLFRPFVFCRIFCYYSFSLSGTRTNRRVAESFRTSIAPTQLLTFSRLQNVPTGVLPTITGDHGKQDQILFINSKNSEIYRFLCVAWVLLNMVHRNSLNPKGVSNPHRCLGPYYYRGAPM